MNELTKQGLHALKNKQKAEAERLFRAALAQDARQIAAWAGLSLLLPSVAEQRYCLERVLALEPGNQFALERLHRLDSQADKPISSPAPQPAIEPLAVPPPQPIIPPAPAAEPDPFRRLIFRFVGRLFAAPHLAPSLVWLALFLIITEGVFVLAGQLPVYWFDHSQAHYSEAFVRQWLSQSPWLFFGFWSVYGLLIAFFLILLQQKPALLLWSGISFFHLRNSIAWSICVGNRVFHVPAITTCPDLGFVLRLAGILVVGVIVAHALFKTAPQRPNSLWLWVTRFAAAGWTLSLVIVLIRASHPPVLGWNPLTPETVPPGRIYSNVAYNPTSQQAILFSGGDAYLGGNRWQLLQDTWLWDGSQWQQLNPAQQPPARVKYGSAYDEARGVVVLFGGIGADGMSLGDTWEWDGVNWHALQPESRPSARCCLQLVYDPGRGRVVLYGGLDDRAGQLNFYNDAWEWDGQNWQPISVNGSPLAAGFGMVYEAQQNRMLAFVTPDTWVWQANEWRSLGLLSALSPRTDLTMSYDSGSGQIILFGGSVVGSSGTLQDTWVFDGTGWQAVSSNRWPVGRWGHVMFYDASRSSILLFGGFDGKEYRNDMWELTLPVAVVND